MTTGNIIWDNTYQPSSYSGNTSPSIHLKINTNYRFYFDDLCNDIDSADRNFSYNNSDHYTLNPRPVKTCNSALMSITHPTDWNTLNRYNSPIDTITVISSSIAGDTLVGKQLVQNYQDYSLSSGSGGQSNQPLQIRGITVGATYIVQIKTLCSVYNDTVTMTAPPSFSANISVNDQSCKLNTAEININFANVPATAGYIKYSIISGPSSFTDTAGTNFTLTYPIQDSVAVGSTGAQVNIYIKGLPVGTYSINVTNQCGDVLPKTITISNADVARISGTVTVNQQCPGASSITFNGVYQHIAGQLIILKQSGGVYTNIGGSAVNATTSGFLPSYTFSGLADGNYEIALLPVVLANTNILGDCDTLYNQFVTLQYQLPHLDSAYGYVCTPGGSDGKVTLFGTKGVRPYQFQMIDNSGSALTAYQTDSTFTGLTKGTYRFRMKDNCGNAVTSSYQLDTLNKAGITPSTNCPSSATSLTLTADTIYQASYAWTFTPLGGTSSPLAIGKAITISPFSSANYGRYTVTYTVAGCSTPVSSSVDVFNCAVVLPVRFLSFTGNVNAQCMTSLSWSVTNEENAVSYTVEGSKNGIDWKTISVINCHHDNAMSKYQFHVPVEQSADRYYRLKINNTDGAEQYSSILNLNSNCNGKTVTVYPNPADDLLILDVTGYNNAVTGKLYNSTGQQVQQQNLHNGANKMITDKLAPGSYHLIINDAAGSQSYNIHILH